MSKVHSLLTMLESKTYTTYKEWEVACKKHGNIKFEKMPDGDVKAWHGTKHIGTWLKNDKEGHVYG